MTGPQSNLKIAWSDELHFCLYAVNGWVCVHCWPRGKKDCTKMHCEKKTIWQRPCSLGNVLLGNLESWHFCGFYVDTYHLRKPGYKVHLFMAKAFPNGSGIFQQNNAPCHAAKNLRNMTKSSRWLGLQISQISIQSCICKQTNLTHGGCNSQLTELKQSATNFLVPDTTTHLQGSWWLHTLCLRAVLVA